MRVGRIVAVGGLAATCACGRIGFSTDIASDALDGDATEDSAAVCITEPFATFPPDLIKYGVGTISVENGRLRLDFEGAADTELGVEIAARSLVGTSVAFHIVSTSQSIFTSIGWHGASGSQSVHLEVGEDQMGVTVNDGTNVDRTYDQPWDPTQTWWRFRAIGTRIFVTTSATGTSWQPLVDVASPFPLDNGFFDIGVGAYLGASGPHVILFDQLSTCGF